VIDPAELGVAAQVLSVRYAERQVRRSEVFHDYGSYGLPDATLDMGYNSWVTEHDYWFGKRPAGALREWPFFAFTDLAEMRAAPALINQLARDFGATVVPGHDARTRQRFPALPGPAAEVAVVLA
jgi:hypothetical protein